MGVSGSGKTSVGRCLAEKVNGIFIEGDDLHPETNIRKMSRGVPLNDKDREPWLARILSVVERQAEAKMPVVACSALKNKYRVYLASIPYVLVYLKGDRKQVEARLKKRTGHFMPVSLLASQFESLEEPDEALVIPIGWHTEKIAQFIAEKLAV